MCNKVLHTFISHCQAMMNFLTQHDYIMKRLLALFTLLLPFIAGVVSMQAQTPDATAISSSEVPDGYYFIASSEATAYNITSPYIAANDGNMKLVARTNVTTDLATSKVGLWYIHKIGTNNNKATYSIRSAENNLYWAAYPNCPLGGTEGVYTILQTAADAQTYNFSGVGGGITNPAYVNANSATSFERNSDGSYNKWKLIPAGVSGVTLHYTAGSHSFDVTTVGVTGKSLAVPTYEYYKDFNPTSIDVAEGTAIYNVTCALNFPFEDGKFYKLKLREFDTMDGNTDLTKRNLVWDGVSANINTRLAETNDITDLWRFELVNGTRNQVRLYSNTNGAQRAVKTASEENNSKLILAGVGETGTNYIFQSIQTGGNHSSEYTNGFRLTSLNGDNINMNDVGGLLGFWTNNGSKTDAGSTFTIFEVETQPSVVTAISGTDENGVTGTMTNLNDGYYCLDGGMKENCIYIPTEFTRLAPLVTRTAGLSFADGTLKFNYQNNFQFPVSTASDKKYVYVRTRKDGENPANCYLKAEANGIKSRNNVVTRTDLQSMRSYLENDANQWAFVKKDGTFNQFYIYNKSTGDKVLYLPAANDGTKLTMGDKNATTGFTSFYIAPQPSSFTEITGGFTIQPDDSNKNAVGDHSDGVLSYWVQGGNASALADKGSIYRVVDQADLFADCKTCVTASATSTNVGRLTTEAAEALNAQESTTAFFTKFDELAAQSTSFIELNTDKLYRIYFSRGNFSSAPTNAYADKNGTVQNGEGDTPDERLVKLVAETVQTPSALVRFAKSGEGYTIQDVNSGQYYGFSYNGSDKLYTVPVTNQSGRGLYTIHNLFNGNPGNVALQEHQCTDATKQYLWSRGSDANEVVNNYPYVMFHSAYHGNATTGDVNTVEAGCVLTIKQVDTYPLTVSAAQYASMCLPFSVTLPDGLTAYKVTGVNRSGNNEMTLVALGSLIAANEPVILAGTAGNYTLTINAAESGTLNTDNILTGTSVPRQGIDDTYYAMAYKALDENDAENKTVGFFQVTTTSMPANKAYLLKSKIPAESQSAMALFFNFDGGQVTGINQVANDSASDNVYYDLNGHRVLYPSRGIYVKGNGQKVLIK